MKYILVLAAITFIAFVGTIAFSILKHNTSNYKESGGAGSNKAYKDKGTHGELLTFDKLDKLEVPHKIYVNAYIPKKDGTSEIDLIMLTEYGIFVIESKNYSGWIYGSEGQREWTQVLNKNSKFKFFNPIWQNKGHITALENYLQLDIPNIYKSYIVFSERCELKSITNTSKDIHILKRDKLTEAVKADLKENDKKLLTAEQINMIKDKLKNTIKVDAEVKEKHISDIKDNLSTTDSKADKLVDKVIQVDKNKDMICPRCGSELVARVAKRGDNKGNKFLGCSSYPKCRYIDENIGSKEK